MSGNETLILDTITSNIDAENKWSVSINVLATMTGLSKEAVTLALHNLENGRYIDQFAIAGTPDKIFGLRLVKK